MLKYGLLAAVAGVSATAMAADPMFRISHGGVSYSMTSTENKSTVAGTTTTTKVKTSEFGTAGWDGFEVAAFPGEYAFYFRPAEQEWAAGMFLNKDLELGTNLRLHSETSDAKATEKDEALVSNSNHVIGVYARYYLAMGDNSMEFGLNPRYIMGTTETKDAADVKTKATTSGMSVTAYAAYVMAVGKNFQYVPGVWVSQTSHETKTKVGAGEETKNKVTALTYGVTLASFRYKF